MSPILWLMAGNMIVWLGFGLYAFTLWRGQQTLNARLARLEIYEKGL